MTGEAAAVAAWAVAAPLYSPAAAVEALLLPLVSCVEEDVIGLPQVGEALPAKLLALSKRSSHMDTCGWMQRSQYSGSTFDTDSLIH